MTDNEARAGVASMDEFDRIRMWYHWMIDRNLSQACYAPSVRNFQRASMADFYAPTRWESANGPDWSTAHSYYQREFQQHST